LHWIQNKNYNPSFASPVLRHFVLHNYDKSDVELFKSKVNTILKFANIEIIDAPEPQEHVKFQIDETKLLEIIKKLYNLLNEQYEDISKDEVIFRDVKSISSIYKLRKGQKPNFLKDANHIFITSNYSLAKANVKYCKENNINSYKIRECLTDDFIGTTLWSETPAVYTKIQEKKIIANCIASLEPNEILLKKFVNQLNKLQFDKSITSDELYFLKSHRLPFQLLAEKTYGDPDNFYDKLPEEILAEIKNKVQFDALIDLEKEKTKHFEAMEEVKLKTIELQLITNDNERIQKNIHKVAGFIAKVTVNILFGILIPIGILIIILTIYPKIFQNKVLYYSITSISAVFGFLNLYFGWSVHGVLKRFETILSTKIKEILN